MGEAFFKFILFVIMFCMVIGLFGAMMAGCPRYRVWQKGLAGKAQLKEAEWNRQIKIEEAHAKQKSAKLLGQANITEAEYAAKSEVIRAKGVAEANRVIGKSLKDNEAYLRYLWIQGLHDGSSETIYIPTEANMPILEANRRK